MATYDYDSTRTWVNVSGTDKRVKVPYVNDDGWKLAHHIWLKHGGEWKIVHKTQKSHGYTLFNTYTYNAGTGQSFTVPAHVRYLEVVIISAAGGGGGGVRSGGAGLEGGHKQCPNPLSTSTVTKYAEGGVGGNGGRIDAVIECKEGQVYTVDVSSGGTGGSYVSPMELHYAYGYSSPAGTSKTGGAGGNGTGSGYGSRLFCSANNTNIYVYNGAGGTGGTVAVSTRCVDSGGYWTGYTVSETDGTAGAAGNTRGSNIASDNLVSSSLSSEGNSYGSKGDHDTNGGAGDDGKVVINTYGPKGSFY